MVADAATVTPDGKLYILGGQWDHIYAAAFPTTHPTMAVVLVIEVSYNEALKDHELKVSLTKDGEPAGAMAMGKIRTGHAPTLELGASTNVSLALPFHQLTFDAPGTFEWVIEVDNEPIGRIPLSVASIPGTG